MRAFLWREKQFFEVNKKEEIDSNIYLITDYEEEMIKQTLDAKGYLWIENYEI